MYFYNLLGENEDYHGSIILKAVGPQSGDPVRNPVGPSCKDGPWAGILRSMATVGTVEKKNKGGRPKGGKNSPSCLSSQIRAAEKITKAMARERLVSMVIRRLEPMVQAQLDKAIGMQVLMVKDDNGNWKRVTDPDLADVVMNSGPMGEAWKIQVIEPDTAAAKYLLDQAIDRPIDRTEVSGSDGQPLIVKWKDAPG